MEGHPFTIKAILSSAWKQNRGSKWSIWAPLLVLIAIIAVINLLASFLFAFIGFPIIKGGFTASYSVVYLITSVIVEIITIFLTAPFIAGAQMVALKRVRGKSIQPSIGFTFWPMWIRLGLTVLIISLGSALLNVIFGSLITVSYQLGFWLVLIFQLIAIIAFIVFYSFYIFSILFVADKKRNPFESLVASVNMVRPHWFQVCKVMACITIGLFIVTLPFFILSLFNMMFLSYLGMLMSIAIAIWAIPYFHLIVARVFNELAD